MRAGRFAPFRPWALRYARLALGAGLCLAGNALVMPGTGPRRLADRLKA